MPCPFTGPKMFCAGPNFLCPTKNLFTYCGSHKHDLHSVFEEALHAIWPYNERWDFPRAGSSLFLPRFSGLTFLRFLGPFFNFLKFSLNSGVLYFLRWFFIFFQLLNEMKGTYMNNKKKSGCFRPICFFWFQHFLEKAKLEISNLFRFKSFKVGKKN